MAVNRVGQARYDAARAELETLRQALMGNRNAYATGSRQSFGFVGDVGALPDSLDRLVSRGTLPPWQTNGLLQFGWRGPYISETTDPWGTPYQYANAWPGGSPALAALPPLLARIWSNGPDRISQSSLAGGIGGDDVGISLATDELFGSVSGNCLDECGAPVVFRQVTLQWPEPTGVQTLTLSPGTSIFSFPVAIPLGLRAISFLAETGDDTQASMLVPLNTGPICLVNLKDPDPCP